MTIRIPIGGIGVRAPGIENWKELTENAEYVIPTTPITDQPKGLGQCLPATERRRATPVTRLALDLAMEAVGDRNTDDLSAVFCSSGGEVTVVHQIFSMLAEGDTALSPTAFHNSVHNAAAGYWSIASGSPYAADSLCAFDDSFGAGLAECCLRYAEGQRNLLLVTYDIPPPHPISLHREIHNAVGGSLLLGANNTQPLAWLNLRYEACPHLESPPLSQSAQVERLPTHPGSVMMALLKTIAQKELSHHAIPAGFGGMLHVKVEPCW